MAAFQRIGGHSYKERRTDTHVYFVGGPFSQWWASEFTAVPLLPRFGEQRFNSAEQYMMASKALLFHDEPVYEAIMRETNPRNQKELGRQAGGFKSKDEWDEYGGPLWNGVARELVYRGNLAKFGQNPDLFEYILLTEDLYIVEGASYDEVWGVKLAFDDPRIEDPANWRGTNWLGEVLMRTRGRLRIIAEQLAGV